MDSISFVAIVKKVEAKALVSLDKSARITLDTDNMEVVEMGKWPGDECVKVIIERMPKGE